MRKKIIPERDLSKALQSVENPGRYVGGEVGQRIKTDAPLRVGVCFPDLYEIGMSNQAVAILYGIIHRTDGATAERVFCPAPDFEAAIKDAGVPIYGLEEGTPLHQFDVLTVTFSYELSATNLFVLLDAGNIPILCKDRNDPDPIVLGGGPALTNPSPFGDFLDGVYIGEAEEDFSHLLEQLVLLKRRGANRCDLLERIHSCPSIWFKGKKENTRRSYYRNFSTSLSPALLFPLPNIKTTQDHGVVEILRGCPHRCRFCHAACNYRPFRMKSYPCIEEEVRWIVEKKGYREITLSSLSSGDYKGVFHLLGKLNGQFRDRFVSFSLPSLRLETFRLDLLSNIAEVRKSGLTFAIETPNPLGQLSLNKRVDKEKVMQLLGRVKEFGWKLAKFYFMIGLPFQDSQSETEEILEFVQDLQRACRIQIHLNVNTFVPKPHTPFQWAGQLSQEKATESIHRIRRGLRGLPVKVGFQAPLLSFLEGMICRGDERVGNLVFQAYQKGARFDAWEDKFNPSAWNQVLNEAPWDIEEFVYSRRTVQDAFPWDSIDLGVSTSYLEKEWNLAEEHLASDRVYPRAPESDVPGSDVEEPEVVGKKQVKLGKNRRTFFRYVISYSKVGKAAYIPHLSLLRIFERSFQRAGLYPRFTEGFNPKPYIEFAQPLSLGFIGLEEICSVDLEKEVDDLAFTSILNPELPQGITIGKCFHISYQEAGKKPLSPMSAFGGGRYRISYASPPQPYDSIAGCLNNDTGTVSNIVKQEDSSEVSYEFDSVGDGQIRVVKNIYTVLKEKTNPTVCRLFCYSSHTYKPLYDHLTETYQGACL